MTTTGREPQPGNDPYDALLEEIKGLVEQMNDLHLQAVRQNRPVVERLIRSGSQDQQEIDRALDRLLDHACIPEGLELFRALCRHYYPINPLATAQYVQAYRDLWDSEQEAGNESDI